MYNLRFFHICSYVFSLPFLFGFLITGCASAGADNSVAVPATPSLPVVTIQTDSAKLKEQDEIAVLRAERLRLATRHAGMLFQNGMANYLEVITAQANALQSELELADIRKQQLYAMVDLYRSLGGGWQ